MLVLVSYAAPNHCIKHSEGLGVSIPKYIMGFPRGASKIERLG